MKLDITLRCSAAQAITATAVSTDAVDLGAAGRDIGVGEPIFANVFVDEAFTAAGAGTLTIDLIEADDAALTSNIDVLASTGAIGKATLVVGFKAMRLAVPPRASLGAQRHLGFRYTVATGPMTAGKVTAFFSRGIEAPATYPSGINMTGL